MDQIYNNIEIETGSVFEVPRAYLINQPYHAWK